MERQTSGIQKKGPFLPSFLYHPIPSNLPQCVMVCFLVGFSCECFSNHSVLHKMPIIYYTLKSKEEGKKDASNGRGRERPFDPVWSWPNKQKICFNAVTLSDKYLLPENNPVFMTEHNTDSSTELVDSSAEQQLLSTWLCTPRSLVPLASPSHLTPTSS